MYEVHDRHSSIDKLLNFDVHFALTNEEITHEDIASIPLYKEPYVLITLRMNFKSEDDYY